MIEFLPLLVLGGGTGILAGYLGIGGGIIIVPVLTELFISRGMELDRVMTSAFATSLFTAVGTTGAAAWRQWRQDNLVVAAIPPAALGAVAGGQVGALMGSRLSGGMLMLLFALFLVAAAVNMTFSSSPKFKDGEGRTPFGWLLMLGIATGTFAALFGVGGGVLMVPAFILLFHLPPGRVAGTSSAVAFVMAISAVAGYLIYGTPRASADPGFWGVIDINSGIPIALGSVLTAGWGARLNKRFGGEVYRRGFGIFLIVVAIRMAWRSLGGG